jgi:Ca2+-binding EF-hand superfamily protein
MPSLPRINGRVFQSISEQTAENNGSQKWKGLGVSASHQEPARHLSIVPYDHPSYKPHYGLTIEKIQELLRDKICSSTRSDVVVKKDTWLAFTRAGGGNRKGLTMNQLRTRLQQWGIRPTDELMEEAFKKWDLDNSGLIDFDEFFMIIMPPDFSNKHSMMHDLAKGLMQKEQCSMNEVYLANIGARVNKRPGQAEVSALLDKGSKELHHTSQMEIHKIVEVIRSKISSHSRGGNREMTDCYALFNRPKLGITMADFKNKLNLWGLHCTKSQLDEIFFMIDADGNGKISFHEFLAFFGAENNHHPLHLPATATGGIKDRRLSFLPGRQAMEGAAIHRTEPAVVRNASGKSVKSITDGGIESAGKVHMERRLMEPSFRNDRNGILRGGQFRSTEVTAFLTRLLQNAHAQIIGQNASCTPFQLIQSRFGGAPGWISVKAFKKIVNQELVGPLRMKPHILNPAIHYYSSTQGPAEENAPNGVNITGMLRDVGALAATPSIKSKLNYDASNMRTIKRHIEAQQTGKSLVHPSFLTPHMTQRTGINAGWDKNGRKTTRSKAKKSLSASVSDASSSWNNLRAATPVTPMPRPEIQTPALTNTALRAAAAAAAAAAATRVTQQTPQLRPRPGTVAGTGIREAQGRPSVGGAITVGGASLVPGFPSKERPSTGRSCSTTGSSSSYGSRHGLGRDEMRDLLREKLRTAGAPRAPGGFPAAA